MLRKEQRPSAKPSSDTSGLEVPPDVAKLDDLRDFLLQEVWDDGTARETGTLLLFAGEGRVKAMLKDRDRGLVCFFTCGAGEDLLGQLDALIGSGGGEWRKDVKAGKK